MQRDIFNRCVQQNGHHNGTSNEVQKLELDALIVGGGFGGCYLLHRLREAGFNVKLVEAGTALGGIWHWSNYPGARVDSPYPVYQLSIPEVFKTFDWKEYYPSSKELQRYFRHLDSVLDISKDTFYETRVQAARWNDDTHKWTVECQNGLLVETRFMHCCLGFAAKRHFPDWAGLDVFQGYICHSSFWPAEGVDLKGKRVAVVGNGATGVQVAQETAKEAKELIVFIRTPNTALPMNQRPIDPVQAKKDLEDYVPRKLIKERCSTYGGFPYDDPTRSLLQDTPEERERVLDAAWARGGFEPLFTYNDLLTDREANRWVYDYWARKVRARITNPEKRDLMAPLEPLHPFMAKRASLEQDYYEQMDKDHVKLIDLKKNPVSHVVPEGIVTEDGQLHKVDIMAMATGFDSLTGGFTQIDFRGVNGQSLEKKWSTDQGALSYLGLAVNDFPNMFYTYGPHAPTAYGNGPSVVEPQGDWITETMKRMRSKSQTRINAQAQAEQEWKTIVNDLHAMTLRHDVDSWYMGTNIPGKPKQALNYAGGLAKYVGTIREKMENDFEGFDVS